ncbi:MAG: DUF4230 domain-containing protein [Peptostreptococcaceae bacterium]|nr:DUF4230 domain-containing protein [Peptostreptococcaceae bacterium]
MKRKGKGNPIVFLFIILLIAVVVFFAKDFDMSKLNPFIFGSSSRTEITTDLLASRIASVKKLITTEYHYTNMGAMENHNEFYGWKVPFTRKSFIISYEGVIYAGVNIDKTDIKIKDKEIIVDLPDAEILSHEIKEDSVTIFDERTSLFNPIQIEDYTSFSSDQKKVMEGKVISNGLLDTAEKNTKEAIKEVLMLSPEIAESYTVTFR